MSRLRDKKDVLLESFKNDLDLQDIVLRNLQLAIQGCIDIGSHVISDEGWGIVGSLNEIFYLLQTKGVIKGGLAERMVSMVGFRNVLVHEYEDINLDIVYNIVHSHLKDIDEYLLAVVGYFKLE
ncbi:MAG: hypothetical protein SCARUB_00341 [Candidatus Scalindua rubra]|uniref:DUF86 domain-containing protein n=1 Tax=Candidatus Scalindua rubra TaxID=1872076 RepID=A0A1E3XFQ2_9BACT|nr:MAG: hypothetical protein SCARUB_00341 [Candidatus Scalindua rubra]